MKGDTEKESVYMNRYEGMEKLISMIDGEWCDQL